MTARFYDISLEAIDAALEAFYAPNGQRPWHPVAVEGMRRALAAAKMLLENGEYPLARFCRCVECQSNPNPGKLTQHDIVLRDSPITSERLRVIAQFGFYPRDHGSNEWAREILALADRIDASTVASSAAGDGGRSG